MAQNVAFKPPIEEVAPPEKYFSPADDTIKIKNNRSEYVFQKECIVDELERRDKSILWAFSNRCLVLQDT